MMRGSDDFNIVGGPSPHIPVMLNEVLQVLEPASGKVMIDGTFGAGGYTSAILEKGANVVAIDRDPNAIRDGAAMVASSDGRLDLVHGEFSDLDSIAASAGHGQVDGVVLDIGVSSMQLDEAERGFSFQQDGPLDMRMARDGVSAADIVNGAAQSDLTRIIGILGEEKKASVVSRAIVNARDADPFSTTRQLVSVIEKVLPRKAKDRIHPATRTFQALRVFVNQELQQLANALFAAERVLKAGGRLVVVTFHSLEDRLVKLFFKDRFGMEQGSRHLPAVNHKHATFQAPGKNLIKAAKGEAEVNPRARSAKLRWAERTSADALPADHSIFGLPNLVPLSGFSTGGGVT
ncbi:MAG: 16S rRNA (cytosine(1402)-N(4))-methyltransferase RsmH [Rhizobiaceae bacterium]|nr:16S rRNA (cytosine(1402)-N(4))-methyltransferase RsmH [Rhizobiaceae bacterium]